MKIYLTTDTHFNHMKLATEFKDRPLDFQEEILRTHSWIDRDDWIIHLGDFCIGNDDRAIKMWNLYTSHVKHRTLVRGNHDKKSTTWYMDRGWDTVVDSLSMKTFGKNILFTHIPEPRTGQYDYNIHGHTHGNLHRHKDLDFLAPDRYHIEIALENTGYKPVILTPKLFEAAARRVELGRTSQSKIDNTETL